ncbi:cytochrome c1 [Prosthecomicrobium pneumaticum]|uniref:Cytochrome c1 n=1 Tax=Prosthecomicrobium pneumaticum TaxID=81895 RepID=A0A7W9FJY9_9HYPH|nr:cytochrome c1 [Prosthecomicrobium pneumaticum]MBB5751990.1 ubiquinol-cytochrome c reductase cytochrome c1 subunit [Prosthecomicrobium pneumaticum]
MKKLTLAAGLALALSAAVPFAFAQEEGGAAHAEGGGEHATAHYPIRKPEPQDWSFAGIFGKYDIGQLQRGYQVYKEVCANCHSMHLVAFRNLAEEGGPGFTAAQVKALAATYTVQDGPDDNGDMFERPALPSDRFPSPYPNAQAAAASNNGKAPPDLSLMAKGRAVERGFPWFLIDIVTQYQEGGPDYIHALLTGYQDPPEGVTVPPGTHYNPYFLAGAALAMPPPLADGQVTYSDGSPETVDQYARDVSAFLMWTAEPHLEARKRIGFQVLIFLGVFAALLYLTKRKIWSNIAH